MLSVTTSVFCRSIWHSSRNHICKIASDVDALLQSFAPQQKEPDPLAKKVRKVVKLNALSPELTIKPCHTLPMNPSEYLPSFPLEMYEDVPPAPKLTTIEEARTPTPKLTTIEEALTPTPKIPTIEEALTPTPKLPTPQNRVSLQEELAVAIPPPPKLKILLRREKKTVPLSKQTPPPVRGHVKPESLPKQPQSVILGVKDIAQQSKLSLSQEEPIETEEQNNELFTPVIQEGNILSFLSNPHAKVLFFAMNEGGGRAVLHALSKQASCGTSLEYCEVAALGTNAEITKWPLSKNLESITLVVDNKGFDCSENQHVMSLISLFLGKGFSVNIAIPRTEREGESRLFIEFMEQQKGASRCARTLRGAIPIEHLDDLHALAHEPLQTVLQKLSEKRERDSTNLTVKEPIVNRINAAIGIYEKGEPIQRNSIVAVNLQLRGITHFVPSTFRSAMLPHPDLTKEENESLLLSKDSHVTLLTAKESGSLENRVILYDNKYWTVASDIRWKGTQGQDFLAALCLKNSHGIVHIQIIDKEVRVNGKVIAPETKIFVCDFKRYARVIPYFDKQGALTGIERTFFGPNAQKPYLGGRRTKLARGLTSGSSSSFYGVENPTYKILGEGSENVLSALETILQSPQLAERLGLVMQEGGKCNCQFTAALGCSDLVKVPIQSSVKTIILLADIDGYNMETKQTLIDTVDSFLQSGLKVKIAFAPASKLGKKRDLNDVLIEEGAVSVEKRLLECVEIHSKEELGSPTEILQLSLSALQIKQQLKTIPLNQQGHQLLMLGNIFIQLKKWNEAHEAFLNALEWADETLAAEIRQGLGSLRLQMNEPDQAIEQLTKSLKIQLKTTQHLSTPSILSIMEDIGRAYLQKKEAKVSLSFFANILKEKIALFGSDDARLASICEALGDVDQLEGHFSRALVHYQKSVRLKQKEFGSANHPNIAAIFEKIGDVYRKQQKHQEALQYYKFSQDTLHKIFCSERHGQDLELCNKIDSLSKKREEKELASPSLPPLLSTRHRTIEVNLLRERARNVRQVVLDLEMTGTSLSIDRITNIGGVALQNLTHTGETFHKYVNPDRSVRPEAHHITCLTHTYLSRFPRFKEIAEQLIRFIHGADLVLHGANLDLAFLDMELKKGNIDYDIRQKHQIIDSLELAKCLFPNEKNSLDALNERLNIHHPRPRHRALLDAKITAKAYIAMLTQ